MINYSERLNKSNVKDLSTINFVKTEITENEVVIYINATNSIYNNNLYYRIARIKRNVWDDNSISYTAISYINGTEKEYKNIKSMLNAIIKVYGSMDKMDSVLKWSSVKKIEVEKVEEIKEYNNNVETPEVAENKINYTKVITYIVYNKSFDNKSDAIAYCLENDFDPELMIEIYVGGVKTVDYLQDVYQVEYQTYCIITKDIDSYNNLYPVGLYEELKGMINTYNRLKTDIKFNDEQIEKYKNSEALTLQILVNASISKNIHHNEMLLQVETHINKIRECITTFKDRYNKKFGRKSPHIECRLNTDMQAVQDDLKEGNNIPVYTNSNKKVDNVIYNTCNINNTAEYKDTIKQIKTLNNYIDILEDKRIQLSNYIRNELNIKCNYHLHMDIKECREYIELNTLIDNKENELIQIQEKRKMIATNNYNKYKDNLITAYGTNKYRIVYNDKVEYSNNIEPFKALECNVNIFMLVNNESLFIDVLIYKKEYDNKLYNNAYNKLCKLESIYNYYNNKYLLLDESIVLNDKLIMHLSSRYDNSNNKIYELIYLNNNNYRESYINIKSNFMIQYDIFNGAENTIVYYNIGLMKTIDHIPVEYQEYINKVNDKLNNNIGLKLVG